LHDKTVQAAKVIAEKVGRTPKSTREHVQMQASCINISAICLVLNFILRAHDPVDEGLRSEHSTFANFIREESVNALQYFPLGSGYMPMSLVAVLSTSEETMEMKEVEGILGCYLMEHQ
jgi:hypothetical protein